MLILRLISIGLILLTTFIVSCSKKHCPTSEGCETYGMCINDGPHRCVTGCEKLCKIEGLCTPDYSEGQLNCIAKFNDCEETEACIKYGRCSAVNGYCIPTSNEQCQESMECGEVGRCKVKSNECMPTSDTDCVRSWACIAKGKCFFKQGERSYCAYPEDF
jgi:hypothetical protein